MHGVLHSLTFTVCTVNGVQQPSQMWVAKQISQLLRLTCNHEKGNSAFHLCTEAKTPKVRMNDHPGAAASAEALGL